MSICLLLLEVAEVERIQLEAVEVVVARWLNDQV
jgi:hypothetical protein